MDEKKNRQEELLLIEREKRALNEEKRRINQVYQSIEQARYDLEVREQRLLEVQDVLSLARQLRDMSLGFEELIPWVASIQERAMMDKIDPKVAANDIAKSLGDFRQLGTLQRTIEQAKQQLAIIDAFNAQKQQAIATLMNLQLAGFSEKDVNDLFGLVNTWNTHWSGRNQGNGSSGSKLDDGLIGH